LIYGEYVKVVLLAERDFILILLIAVLHVLLDTHLPAQELQCALHVLLALLQILLLVHVMCALQGVIQPLVLVQFVLVVHQHKLAQGVVYPAPDVPQIFTHKEGALALVVLQVLFHQQILMCVFRVLRVLPDVVTNLVAPIVSLARTHNLDGQHAIFVPPVLGVMLLPLLALHALLELFHHHYKGLPVAHLVHQAQTVQQVHFIVAKLQKHLIFYLIVINV